MSEVTTDIEAGEIREEVYESETPLETARRQLDAASRELDIDPNVVERLRHPRKSFHLH